MNRVPRQTQRNSLTAPIRRIRFAWVAIFFAFWVSVIGLRLVWLQVIRHSDWVDKAKRQQQRTFAVEPRRGVLYDRNLRELAMSVEAESVYAVPTELGDNRANAASMLASVVHTDPNDRFTSEQQLLQRFTDSRNFAWVARRVDPDVAGRVRELNLRGVYFTKEPKRFYPNGDLAAEVLGYVGMDDIGLGGLEQEFDADLHGIPGHALIAVDAKRHVRGSTESDPIPGQNLVLSIDANIQYMAEQALDEQMAKVKAEHGTIVVQDPHTGQILALAISPRFNPNDSRHVEASSLTDLAVSDIYEPGSTFKLVTYSAAMDGAGVQPDDTVDCQGGKMTMFGRTLHDDKSDHYGVITVRKALEVSSDVGAAKMALKLGPEKFYSYMRAFGFGDRSGIELPSETRGLLRPPRRWGSTSILSLAIGQEVGVTPIQLVTMVSSIANGGVYLPPHILLQSTDYMKGDARLKAAAFHPEAENPSTLPDGAHRVISELTAAKMRSIMEGIVIEGTGKEAALNGYSSAGKTGTAEKIDPATHTYSHTKLVASFAGFAPVNNPAISVAVVIDTPTVGTGYGGTVSAPVFSKVAQEVLEYLGVPHDQPLKTSKQMAVVKQSDIDEDAPSEDVGDMTAMFDQINNLPADDPLRQSQSSTAAPAALPPQEPEGRSSSSKQANAAGGAGLREVLPKKLLSAFTARTSANSDTAAPLPKAQITPAVQQRTNGSVVIDAARRVAIPSFIGADLRKVVETAASLGLRVEPLGSGIAREQVPAAGTQVPVGTEVVVRFTR